MKLCLVRIESSVWTKPAHVKTTHCIVFHHSNLETDTYIICPSRCVKQMIELRSDMLSFSYNPWLKERNLECHEQTNEDLYQFLTRSMYVLYDIRLSHVRKPQSKF